MPETCSVTATWLRTRYTTAGPVTDLEVCPVHRTYEHRCAGPAGHKDNHMCRCLMFWGNHLETIGA
jgi:hypothetical protein